MAALDYQSLPTMVEVVTDAVPTTSDEEAEALLVASAGNDCGDPPQPVYRPYWVIARLLEARPTQAYVRVRSSAGSEVEYRDHKGAMRGMNTLQSALDSAICGIPTAFTTGGSIRVAF